MHVLIVQVDLYDGEGRDLEVVLPANVRVDPAANHRRASRPVKVSGNQSFDR